MIVHLGRKKCGKMDMLLFFSALGITIYLLFAESF